jgi:hypothetical protein
MSGRADGDPGREVEETVAVHVLDDGTGGTFDDERVIARVRRGTAALVFFDIHPGVGAGKGGLNPRSRADPVVSGVLRRIVLLDPKHVFVSV